MTHESETAGLQRLLAHPDGLTLVAKLPAIHSPADILSATSKLKSEGYDAELIAAALTQQRLRAKAETKFGPFAADLLFTTEGLEQATRLDIAARHAQRFRDAGCTRVADLGCGIGTEAFALAGLGLDVVAVDADETHAALALLNLRTFPSVSVHHARIEDLDLAALRVDGAFADPARRGSGERRFDPETWSPPLSSILALRDEVPNLSIKVAPGIAYEHVPADVAVQWTSVAGSVVEAAIWCGVLVPEGPSRTALVLAADGTSATYRADISSPRAPSPTVPVAELGTYLHEVDGAILRAGALSAVADTLGAGLISERISYLTSDAPADLVGVTSFKVDAVLPAKTKTLAAELKKRDIGSLEILKRGTDIVPDVLRRQLKLRGERAATLIMTRIDGRHRAILASRC